MSAERGTVVAVGSSDAHHFTKPIRDEIVLVAGLGVEGDAHAGVNVRHRSRVAVDPSQPNLRQVHLIHAELFEEVAEKGYEVPAGGLGENVTTSGIDLLGLPRGTILRFGPQPGPGPTAPSTGTAAEQDVTETPNAPAAPSPAEAPSPSGGPGPSAGRSQVETSSPAEAPNPAMRVGGTVGSEANTAVGSDAASTAGHGVGGPVAAVLAAAAAATLDEATARAAAAVAAAVERDAAAMRQSTATAEPDAATTRQSTATSEPDAAATRQGVAAAGRDAAAVGRDVAAAGGGVDSRPAVVIAGLRNPCAQINGFRKDLLKEVLGRDSDGNLVRKAGVMGVVLRGGTVHPGDAVAVELPPGPHMPLERV
jgi:hypothetical protein